MHLSAASGQEKVVSKYNGWLNSLVGSPLAYKVQPRRGFQKPQNPPKTAPLYCSNVTSHTHEWLNDCRLRVVAPISLASIISFLVGWILINETSATPIWSAIVKALAVGKCKRVRRYIWVILYIDVSFPYPNWWSVCFLLLYTGGS